MSNEEVCERANIALNKGEDLNMAWEEFIRANPFDKPKKFCEKIDLAFLIAKLPNVSKNTVGVVLELSVFKRNLSNRSDLE